MRNLLTRRRAGVAAVVAGTIVSLTLLTGCPAPPYGGVGMGNGGRGTKLGYCASHNC
jgi:hypothetical protein